MESLSNTFFRQTSAKARWALTVIAVLAMVALTANPAFAEDPPECVEHGLTVEALGELVAADTQTKKMRPWTLQSIQFEPCAVGGILPLKLEYYSSETASKLNILYQLFIDVTLEIETSKISPLGDLAISKQKAVVDKSMRAAEKDALVKELVSSAEQAGAIASTTGELDYLIPVYAADASDPGSSPVIRWNSEGLGWADLPWDAPVTKSVMLAALKASVPAMVEGKTCDTPARYRVDFTNPEMLVVTFKIEGTCNGKWRLDIARDGTVTSTKL